MLYEFEMGERDIICLKNLIPEACLEGLRSGDIFGIAAYDSAVDAAHLVGIVLIRVRYGFQEIVWTALTENYALPEYGADLIRCRQEAVLEAGSLYGTFSDIPKTEKEMQEYFRLAGFEIMEPEDDNSFVRAVKLREKRKAHWLMRKLKPAKA